MTYKIYLNYKKDIEFIKQVILDDNGWKSKFNDIAFTNNIKNANVIIYFLDNQNIIKKFKKNFNGFSVCNRGVSPHEIYINTDRWNNTPSNFKVDKNMIINNNKKKTENIFYRQYVLQHELGHSIDLANHDHIIHKNYYYFGPVMYQQTRGNIQNEKILFIPNPWITFNYKRYNKNNLKDFLNTQSKYKKFI